MQAQEFVSRVQQQAHLADPAAALNASRATLLTLAERLPGEEPDHLGAQLPPEIARYLEEADGHQEGFGADEFFARVGDREGVDAETARDHARAVIRVVSEAVTPGELDDVRRRLPAEYAQLFGDDSLLA